MFIFCPHCNSNSWLPVFRLSNTVPIILKIMVSDMGNSLTNNPLLKVQSMGISVLKAVTGRLELTSH